MITNRYLPFVLVLVLLGSFGCGGSDVASNQSNVKTTNSAVNTQVTVSNSELSPSDANAVNANPSSVNANSHPVTVTTPNVAGPNTMTRPAPDNSEVSVALGEDLIQTRTFKNHPVLLKVEKITDGKDSKKVTTKVYLKSGEVKEIAAGKIADPMTESAAKILAAIGKN